MAVAYSVGNRSGAGAKRSDLAVYDQPPEDASVNVNDVWPFAGRPIDPVPI
jgi:hypothetical protein